MKKILVYSFILLVMVAVTACGRKDSKQNFKPQTQTEIIPAAPSKTSPKDSLSQSAQETESLPEEETLPETEVVADSPVVTVSSEPETQSNSKDTSASQPGQSSANSGKNDSDVTPKDKDDSSSDLSTKESEDAEKEKVSGIVVGKDGTITVGQETVEKILEEEKDLIEALGFTDEELDALLEDGDLVITPELKEKLLEYVDSLSFAKKLKLMTKLAELMDN